MAITLTGCTHDPVFPPAYQAPLQPYLLDSGDEIRIVVFEQDELTNTYEVDGGGRIAFPLIGAVQARGTTLRQLEATIEAKLRNGFLRKPDVSAEILTYRPFFILGEVANPGQYPFVNGMTVQTAIAIAGGFTDRANKKEMEISRQAASDIIHGYALITSGVHPGDTIYVRERFF